MAFRSCDVQTALWISSRTNCGQIRQPVKT
jgi:hypothetical protein